MRKYILVSLACTLFLTSSAFVLLQETSQEKSQEEPKVKPLKIPDSSKYDDLVKQVEALTRELAESKKKGDSINVVREADNRSSSKSVADLRAANAQYRRALNRLKFILEKFPPDSVMKFYGEYKDPDTATAAPDTVKKKIDEPVILVPHKRRGIFQRIFRRNR